MAGSQKTVLKNPVSLNISLGLLVLIIFGLLTGLYYLSPVEKVPSITNSLMVGFMILGLWLIIRNFIFKLEIRETGLGYRSETGQSVLIPWSNIKRFSTRKSVLLKRRLEIHCENEGKPQTLSLWAVTAWQNPEFMELLVEKAGLSLPDDWEKQKSKSIQINIWVNYILGGFFLVILLYHLLHIFFIEKSMVIYCLDLFSLNPPNLLCFSLLVCQIVISNHYQKNEVTVSYSLALLFFALSLPYLSILYGSYWYGNWGFMLSYIPALNNSLLGLIGAVTLGGCLFAGLYPFWPKTGLTHAKTLLPASIVVGFLFWFLPITQLPSAPINPSQSLGKISPQLSVVFNNGSIGVGGIVNDSNTEKVAFTTLSSFAAQPKTEILLDSQNNTLDYIYGASLSPDKSVLLIDGFRSIDTSQAFRVLFRYDSVSHTMKELDIHPITFDEPGKSSSNSHCFDIISPGNTLWSPDNKQAAFFRPFGLTRVNTLLPENENNGKVNEVSNIPVLSLRIYDRDKDQCRTLSTVTGTVSSPFWLNNGSLGFFLNSKSRWQLVQIPPSALSSFNSLNKAKFIPWPTASDKAEIKVASDSHWAWEIQPDMKGVFTELTSGQYAQVTVQLPNSTVEHFLFRPGHDEFIAWVNDGVNPYYQHCYLNQPHKSEILLNKKSWPLTFAFWQNERYLLFRNDEGYESLLDMDTHQQKVVWPVKRFNLLQPRYLNLCLRKFPTSQKFGVIALEGKSLFQKNSDSLLYRYDLPSN